MLNKELNHKFNMVLGVSKRLGIKITSIPLHKKLKNDLMK